MRILFANIGWMIHYRGYNPKDQIDGGGSYRNDDKHEVYNFMPIDGICYGYVQPVKWGAINLRRIDRNCDAAEQLNNVLVVWMATHPQNGGTYILGWYKNATVYSKFQASQLKQRKYYEYNITAKAEDCILIPLDQRTFKVPRANVIGKGFLGQSNVWYADSDLLSVKAFQKDVIDYINAFQDIPVTKQVKIDAEARKQVELAAVKFVTEKYKRFGYQVTSREKENIGWDLDAAKEHVSLKLEVKGLAQSQISVRISNNEYKSMMNYKDSYRLCVVTNAIQQPVLTVFIWDSILRAWVSDKDQSLVLSIEERPSYLAEVE
jgi:hypothetical protein